MAVRIGDSCSVMNLRKFKKDERFTRNIKVESIDNELMKLYGVVNNEVLDEEKKQKRVASYCWLGRAKFPHCLSKIS